MPPANGAPLSNPVIAPAPPQEGDFHQPPAHTPAVIPPGAESLARPHQHHQHGAPPGNVSDEDTEMTDAIENSLRQPLHPVAEQRQYPPLVDFTGAFRSPKSANDNNSALASKVSRGSSSSTHPTSSQRLSVKSSRPQRKRSFTVAEAENDSQLPHSLSSILNPNRQMGDVPIEPSLLALDAAGDDNASNEERKRQILLQRMMVLERESKRIREEMESCDRELERLSRAQDGSFANGPASTMTG